MNQSPYEGSERRTFFRISYPSSNRPKLIIGSHGFEIADISEGGIRFFNPEKTKIVQPILGTLKFLCGESMDIEATVVWQQDNEVGLLLKNYIPPATMENEKQHVILTI
jgi:hypothetical protein